MVVSWIGRTHEIMRVLALGLRAVEKIGPMGDRVVRAGRRHMAGAIHLQILGVISIVMIGLEGQSSAADPAFEAALVEEHAVLQRAHAVVEIGRTFAAKARLFHFFLISSFLWFIL